MGNHAWLMGVGWGCWDRNSGLLGWGSSTVNHSLLSSSEEPLTVFLGMLAIIPYRTNLKPLFLFLYISPLFVCCVWQCFLPCVMQRQFFCGFSSGLMGGSVCGAEDTFSGDLLLLPALRWLVSQCVLFWRNMLMGGDQTRRVLRPISKTCFHYQLLHLVLLRDSGMHIFCLLRGLIY